MSNTWFISDTHFCHANIIDYCLRPHDNVHYMNEDMIKKWNERVMPDDRVYHLGDFGLGGASELAPIIHRLNGSIHLIRGNHDGRKDGLYESEFDKVSRDYFINIGDERVYLVHKPQDRKFDYFTICGHTHDHWRWLPNRLNVSVEQWDYCPVSVEEVEFYLENNQYHKEHAEENGYVFDKEAKLSDLGMLEGSD